METVLKAALVTALGSGVVIFVFLFGFFVALIFAWPLQLAWNYVIPAIFGLSPIGFWQAFCLIVVSNLLIKGSSSSSSGSKS